MDEPGEADQLAAIGGVEAGHEGIVRLLGLVMPGIGSGGDEAPACEVLEDVACGTGREEKGVSHFVQRPSLGPASPQQEQRFEVGNGIDLVDDKTIDFSGGSGIGGIVWIRAAQYGEYSVQGPEKVKPATVTA